jgi:pimeloyl-ACP methyl ester carboxylesterase
MMVAAVLSLLVCSAFASSVIAVDKMTPGEHDALINGLRLHYTVHGQGPLLIVSTPGWGIGSLYLQRGLAPLEKNHTVLYIDPRGNGSSARPADDKQMSGAIMADDIEQLRLYLGLEKFDMLGHSDGGTIAVEYAERYASHVSCLILVNSITIGNSEMNKLEDANRNQIRRRLSSDPRYSEALKPFTPKGQGDAGMLEVLLHELPFYFADPQKNLPIFARQTENAVHPSYYAMSKHEAANSAHEYRQLQQLGQITARTLVLVGAQDWVCPVMDSEHLQAGIHGARLEILEGAGHFSWVEQPEEFFAKVDAFLNTSK